MTHSRKKYKDLSKLELIDRIHQLERNRKTKYGLVWEDKSEDVVEQCQREFPVLEEVTSKAILNDSDNPVNLLIEGDNYHALSVLNYTHKGEIDVIYIDPPYNTGAKDWKYNNNYVDENDQYRHSKWLSFMSNRLHQAKNLLKKNGVLIVTIDDYELHSMTSLLSNLNAHSLGRATICIKPEGRRQRKYLMEAHEYALFVSWGEPKMRGLNVDFGLDFPEEDEISKFKWEGLMRRDSGREDRGSDYWYPMYVDENNAIHFEKSKNRIETFPINTKGIERVWLWDKERAKGNLSEIKAVTRRGKPTIYYKRRELGRQKPTTFWFGSKYNANAHGTRLLKKILPDTDFLYPKSVFSVLDCIDLFLPENGTVLDYFAGSGTTAHATMILNQSDNGKRKFIVCTNNENNNGNGHGGIAETVCYPRIQKVMQGYREHGNGERIKGLGGNLKYFKTLFVSAATTDENKYKLTDKAGDMLCVREGTYEIVKTAEHYKIYRNKKKYTGIIYRTETIGSFKKAIAHIDGKFVVYVFSLGDETYEEEFLDMADKVTLKPIPEAILRVYRRIFHRKGG